MRSEPLRQSKLIQFGFKVLKYVQPAVIATDSIVVFEPVQIRAEAFL